MRWTIWIGAALSVLLSIGAYQQWRGDSIMAMMAIGFAAAMVLTTLTAGLPKTSLESGMRLVRGLAFLLTGYAAIQVAAGAQRAVGALSLNPNALAGLLIVSAVHWLTTSRSNASLWGSWFILMGVPLTGSRWGMLVLSIIIVYLAVRRVVSFKGAILLSTVVAIYVAILLTGALRFDPIIVDGASDSATASLETHQRDALERWYVPPELFPTLVPQGFLGPLGFGAGGHNTFSRVAVETGWLGISLFLGVIALAFSRANKALRPVLGVFLLLGMADYYIWGPFQLAPLMWAFFGLSTQRVDGGIA